MTTHNPTAVSARVRRLAPAGLIAATLALAANTFGYTAVANAAPVFDFDKWQTCLSEWKGPSTVPDDNFMTYCCLKANGKVIYDPETRAYKDCQPGTNPTEPDYRETPPSLDPSWVLPAKEPAPTFVPEWRPSR